MLLNSASAILPGSQQPTSRFPGARCSGLLTLRAKAFGSLRVDARDLGDADLITSQAELGASSGRRVCMRAGVNVSSSLGPKSSSIAGRNVIERFGGNRISPSPLGLGKGTQRRRVGQHGNRFRRESKSSTVNRTGMGRPCTVTVIRLCCSPTRATNSEGCAFTSASELSAMRAASPRSLPTKHAGVEVRQVGDLGRTVRGHSRCAIPGATSAEPSD